MFFTEIVIWFIPFIIFTQYYYTAYNFYVNMTFFQSYHDFCLAKPIRFNTPQLAVGVNSNIFLELYKTEVFQFCGHPEGA